MKPINNIRNLCNHLGLIQRPMVNYIKEHLGNNIAGAEIGVLNGHNALSMLNSLSLSKLYLIDTDTSNIISKVRNNTKTTIITGQSSDVHSYLPDNLDFIYIDGDHSYSAVKKDIELYYPKVREGGILGGHDFCANQQGVVRAVMELGYKFGIKLEGRMNDWWVRK